MATIVAALEALGLTNKQAITLIDLIGIESEGEFEYIEEPDLVNGPEHKDHPGLGLRRVQARKILRKLGVSTQERGGVPTEITFKVDSGPTAVQDLSDPEELLQVIENPSRSQNDKKQAAQRLESMGYPLVKQKDVLDHHPEQTRELWKHEDLNLRFWSRENLQVLRATSFFEEPDQKVELDPFEFAYGNWVVLHDGFNPKSGADWKNVSPRRRALVAIHQGTVARHTTTGVDLAVSMSAEKLVGYWKIKDERTEEEEVDLMVNKRLTRTRKSVRDYHGRQSLARPGTGTVRSSRDAVRGASGADQSDLRSLEELLKQFCGNSQEFHIFWRRHVNISDSLLPSDRVSMNETAAVGVQLLNRHGWLTSYDLWNALISFRPNRVAEIKRLAWNFGVYYQ